MFVVPPIDWLVQVPSGSSRCSSSRPRLSSSPPLNSGTASSTRKPSSRSRIYTLTSTCWSWVSSGAPTNLVAALFVAINGAGRRKMVVGGEAGTVLLICADVVSIINSTEVCNSRSSWRLSPMCSDLNCSNNPQQDVEQAMIHDGLSITHALWTDRIFDGGFIW